MQKPFLGKPARCSGGDVLYGGPSSAAAYKKFRQSVFSSRRLVPNEEGEGQVSQLLLLVAVAV